MTPDQLAALTIFGPFLTAALVLGIALHIKGN
jgi:hypothetical protein